VFRSPYRAYATSQRGENRRDAAAALWPSMLSEGARFELAQPEGKPMRPRTGTGRRRPKLPERKGIPGGRSALIAVSSGQGREWARAPMAVNPGLAPWAAGPEVGLLDVISTAQTFRPCSGWRSNP